ncbi:Putative oxidoreductase YncB [Labilithrix luteola]|uniref:Putative oxidoreductase YncB n=1 Tax=Labilithrix luteola TaxID=1391654 RepID=A0A0K1Q4Y8_9BACT|nr:NADP-dependent oxidoreductase [Labilithrix luteola]AKV00712.1 Putative oxidoreductase YncB [Labilithrix luteola]
MALKNTQVLLAARPQGWVTESDFRIVETDIPSPNDGEILVKNTWLSLDPYMRGRMSDRKSYAKPVDVGAVMIGGTVGEVIESKNPAFAKGDLVVGTLGWQEYAVTDGRAVRKVDPSLPHSVYLGTVGMPGVTAWLGLIDFGTPKAGETVVVSAASGAVGSVVGQLAKSRGCRAVGIAGGAEKCAYVTRELGFDACVDYKDPSFEKALAEATPNGVDVYFENVGGPVLDAVLPRLNAFARIPLCGLIADYNAIEPYAVKHFGALLTNRVRLQGFIVSEHLDRWPTALAELSQLVREGKLVYRETVAHGLREAPRAFIGLLKGQNLGKQVVKLA